MEVETPLASPDLPDSLPPDYEIVSQPALSLPGTKMNLQPKSTGQVVKLPSLTDGSSKSTKVSSRSASPGKLVPLGKAASSNSSVTTQGASASSVHSKLSALTNSSGNNAVVLAPPRSLSPTIPRNTFPSSESRKIKQGDGSNALGEMKGLPVKMLQKKTQSKAMSISSSHPLGNNYKYKIMPGNNSRVVMTAMKKRPWWHAILGNNAAEAEDENDLSAISPVFLWEMIRRHCRYRTTQFHNTLMNHIQRNVCLVTKKGLYLSLKSYCAENDIELLSVIPRTFYLAPGESSKSMRHDDMDDFVNYCQSRPEDRAPEDQVWIMKPASKTNRGFGIKVVQGLDRVLNIVQRGYSASSTDSSGGRARCSNQTTAVSGSATSAGIACSEESQEEDDDEEDDEDPQHQQPTLPINNATAVTKASNNNNNNNSDNLAAYDANPLSKQARMIARTDGYIVQAYLERPLLVRGRKFDIRCFVLVTVLPARFTSNNNNNNNSLVAATSAGHSSPSISIDATTHVPPEEGASASSDDNTTFAAAISAAVEAADLQSSLSAATATVRTESPTATTKASKKGSILAAAKKSTANPQAATNNNSSTTKTMPPKAPSNPAATTASTRTSKSGREKEVRAYFFSDAYIRTSCKKYTASNFGDRETHLTNDAVQKHAKSYGAFEEGNKISLEEWDQLLVTEYPDRARPNIVFDQIFPEIKRLSKISIAACAKEFAVTDIHKSFELFGYDYMIREDLSPVLIEVNTNPCLEFVCPLLTQVITDVIEHTMRMTVDKEFPPPPKSIRTKMTEEAVQNIQSTPIKFEALYP